MLNIYSITYTGWVIIKQEGTIKLNQNIIPFLVLWLFFSQFLRCFPFFVFSFPYNRKQQHAVSRYPPWAVFFPERQPSLLDLPKEHNLPACLHDPSLLTWHTALRYLFLVATSYGSDCHGGEPFPILRAWPRPFFSSLWDMPSEFTCNFFKRFSACFRKSPEEHSVFFLDEGLGSCFFLPSSSLLLSKKE